MQKAKKNQENPYFIKMVVDKKYLFSFSSFIFLTVILYLGLGRPDLLQPQLLQKELELSYIKGSNGKVATEENEKLFLLYRKLSYLISFQVFYN